MFNFFKKKEVSSIEEVASHIFSDDLCKKAICSNALFQNPSLFLDMKLTDEKRAQFVENNFFNLRYTGGSQEQWDKQKKHLIPAMKEALKIGYDIVDKQSYEAAFASFMEGELTHAWDIVRMVGVTQDAYTVSYIDLALAGEKIAFLGQKISDNYTSWEAVATDFIKGKLEFNDLKELEGQDTTMFADIEDILVMVDFLFNDKDTPLKQVRFNKEENLGQAGKNILGTILSPSQRARNMMKVYKKVYGWEPFVLIDGNMSEERDENTYRFVQDKLKLQPAEEIVFMHAYTHKKPEKSELQLLVTNQRIISFLARKKEYIYIPFEEINESSLAIRGYGKELFINGRLMLECFCIHSEEEIAAYLEIVYDLVAFLRQA
ncbi:MAG: DUF1266 domain-containing protein [Cellulosilyticaceae bacterium]